MGPADCMRYCLHFKRFVYDGYADKICIMRRGAMFVRGGECMAALMHESVGVASKVHRQSRLKKGQSIQTDRWHVLTYCKPPMV